MMKLMTISSIVSAFKEVDMVKKLIFSNVSLVLMILALSAFVATGFLFCLKAGLIVLGLALGYLSFIITQAQVKGGD